MDGPNAREIALRSVSKCPGHESPYSTIESASCEIFLSVELDSAVFLRFLQTRPKGQKLRALGPHLSSVLKGICVFISHYEIEKCLETLSSVTETDYAKEHIENCKCIFAVENIETFQHWSKDGNVLAGTDIEQITNESIRRSKGIQVKIETASYQQQSTQSLNRDIWRYIIGTFMSPKQRLVMARTCKLMYGFVMTIAEKQLPCQIERVLTLYGHEETLKKSILAFLVIEEKTPVHVKLALLYWYDRVMYEYYRAVSWDKLQRIRSQIAISKDSYARVVALPLLMFAVHDVFTTSSGTYYLYDFYKYRDCCIEAMRWHSNAYWEYLIRHQMKHPCTTQDMAPHINQVCEMFRVPYQVMHGKVLAQKLPVPLFLGGPNGFLLCQCCINNRHNQSVKQIQADIAASKARHKVGSRRFRQEVDNPPLPKNWTNWVFSWMPFCIQPTTDSRPHVGQPITFTPFDVTDVDRRLSELMAYSDVDDTDLDYIQAIIDEETLRGDEE